MGLKFFPLQGTGYTGSRDRDLLPKYQKIKRQKPSWACGELETIYNHSRHSTTWINQKKCWRHGHLIIPSEASFLLLPILETLPRLDTSSLSVSPSITHTYTHTYTYFYISRNQNVPRNRIRIYPLITI